MKRVGQIGILVAFCLVGANAAPILMVEGNMIASGAPGSIVGWGYQVVNDTAFYLLVDASAFCGPGGDIQLNGCNSPYDGVTNFGPALGTYTDLIANNFTIFAPNATTTLAFDLDNQLGFGEYQIGPTVAPGSTDPANPATQTSSLFLTYEEFDGDPLSGGTQVPGTGDFELSAPVEVQVPATPEPGTWLLMAAAFLMFGGWRAVRSRSMRTAR
jgi:hypothetical protein